MIPTKELRLGNIVLVKHSFYQDGMRKAIDKNWTVAIIYKNRVDYSENYCKGCPPKEPHPIKLTDWWLNSFGFALQPSQAYRNENYVIVPIIEDGSYSLGIAFQDNSITHLRNLKYVHELQNLYFALTGKELSFIQLSDGKK